MRVVRCMPADQLEWTCRPGQFTLVDLARHLATTERYIFAETIQSSRNRYPGCGKELADGLENVIGLMERLHSESLQIFSELSEEDCELSVSVRSYDRESRTGGCAGYSGPAFR